MKDASKPIPQNPKTPCVSRVSKERVVSIKSIFFESYNINLAIKAKLRPQRDHHFR